MEVNDLIENVSKELKIPIRKENMVCTECFDPYLENVNLYLKQLPEEKKIVGSEMESFALFYTAKVLDKKAACLLTVVDSIKKKQKEIMRQLQVFAEYLKLELNERCSEEYSSGWDDEEEEQISVGGNMGGIAYDDRFSKEEVEAVFDVFMAKELLFADYKKIKQIDNTRNIIYPILDVLKKAADKLGREVIVDAVILNGGMSKFYMVQNRLKQFFGFDPIVALDPDQAVARGAAIYHYYLHQYEELQEDMK
ncbi:MAG: Hsp70 family protein, partial [Lachnospiraceae bacterium]|nr:Hsp70 family protein [Lachnospiraceae bacterium]